MAHSTLKKLYRTNSAKSQPHKSKKPVSRKLAQRRSPVSALPTTKRPARPNSKASQVIALLRSPSGATLGAMMRPTEWQQHSVRGFLAAVVRKKLELDLQSTIGKDGRVYRIRHRNPSTVTRTKTAA